MEVYQREHIRQNLNALIENTDCNVSFISHLVSKNVLGDYDVESLRVIEHRYDKAAKFYDIVVEIADSYNIIREAFQETCQTGAEAIFNQLASSPVASCSSSLKTVHPDLESRTRKRIRYEVRSPVHLFTGRDEEISLLHENMTCRKGETETTAFLSNTTTVTGLGGIGKTELCRKYIELYSEYYDGNVVWIQAEREVDLTRDFRSVAKDHLKISLNNMDGSEKDIKTVVDEVYKYFMGKRALFVFDNVVRSEDEHLDIFMPIRVTTKPAIIITSRDRDFIEMPSKILNIRELKEVEAVEFVKRGLSIKCNFNDTIITDLVKRLQCFPLAIQQAVSFIKERGKLRTFEIEEYLSLFETNTKNLLKAKGGGFTLPTNSYSMTTYTAWKITTDMIASEEEFGQLSIQCLNMMAYFEPDRIPMDLFLKRKEDSFEAESALQLLVKYSMINTQPSEEMLSIHRLVQEVIRIQLKSEEKEEQVLKDCLSIFNFDFEEEKEVGCTDVNHAKAVLEFSISNPTLLKEFSLVPFNIGQTLIVFKHGKESHEFCIKWHKILTESLPDGNVAIIHIELLLAINLYMAQKYEESLEAFYLILAKYSSIQFNKNHQYMIWQTNFLIAETLMSLAQFKESLELSRRVIIEQLDNPQRNNKELKRSAQIAFKSYLNLGNLKGALDWCDTMINSFYPDELQTISEEQQDLDEDERTSHYLEEIGKKVTKLMELDKIWIEFADHLADYSIDVQGQNEGSLQIALKTYELTKKYYGEEHIKTLNALLKIANINSNIGNYAEAVSIIKKLGLAKIFEQPGQIPLTFRNLINVIFESNNAIALSGLGAHEEALERVFHLFDSLVELHGTDNIYLFPVLYCIANVYVAMNKFDEALEVSLEAAKLAEKVKTLDPNLVNKNFNLIDALRLELNCNPD